MHRREKERVRYRGRERERKCVSGDKLPTSALGHTPIVVSATATLSPSLLKPPWPGNPGDIKEVLPNSNLETSSRSRRREEREMQPESLVPGSLLMAVSVRAQTQLHLVFLPTPGHALVCLGRQEHGGSLWNYQGSRK